MWFDCDTFFMNMETTIESVLYRYAGIPRDELAARQEATKLKKEAKDAEKQQNSDPGSVSQMKERASGAMDAVNQLMLKNPPLQSTDEIVLDPSIHFIIAEDNAMLNSGNLHSSILQ
jgi:hypothetical protein